MTRRELLKSLFVAGAAAGCGTLSLAEKKHVVSQFPHGALDNLSIGDIIYWVNPVSSGKLMITRYFIVSDDGLLPLDGCPISDSGHPRLYRILVGAYGIGNGMCNLPDLRARVSLA